MTPGNIARLARRGEQLTQILIDRYLATADSINPDERGCLVRIKRFLRR